ncbi:MAG: hypothetical protein COB14_02920 [Alphaproteobacteria bacterium]|nr:MAG: hypothetical protein COB14_02920 [Alphaproteobacteria bacterium]
MVAISTRKRFSDEPDIKRYFALLIFSTITVLVAQSDGIPGLQLTSIMFFSGPLVLALGLKVTGVKLSFKAPFFVYFIVFPGLYNSLR